MSTDDDLECLRGTGLAFDCAKKLMVWVLGGRGWADRWVIMGVVGGKAKGGWLGVVGGVRERCVEGGE